MLYDRISKIGYYFWQKVCSFEKSNLSWLKYKIPVSPMRIIYLLCLFLIVSFAANGQAGNASLPERTVKLIKFYPNPAVTQITFDFELGYDKNHSFQIFNFTGKKVFELYSVTPKALINVSDFYRGVYIFQLKDRNGKIVESGKFQVAH
jgi:hypothetical protein